MPSDSIAQAIDRYLETLRKHCARGVTSRRLTSLSAKSASHIMDRIIGGGQPHSGDGKTQSYSVVGDPKQLAGAPGGPNGDTAGSEVSVSMDDFFAAFFALL